MNNLSIDDLLNRAFLLACFISGDRESATEIVSEAMGRLEVTTAAQGKRLYYKPVRPGWMNRDKSERYRNKVHFSELHLLQRLIYIMSEPYEQRKEKQNGRDGAGHEDMLIHFIKHLVRITIRRNSFYVTLGLSRFLYNYTTAETMEVYNAVIQDPERVKDDYYYRSRKGVLMQELKNRFGSLIEITRGPRGEERFRASEEQGKFAELVRECLSFFTPWQTPCLVPAGVNPITDGIIGLSSHNQQEEDKVEVDRIHAVLHPDCFQRLVKSLGFGPSERRLGVPHFFLSKDNGRGGGGENTREDRRRPDKLGQDELAEIKDHLDGQSERRKRAFAGLLRILVDGSERARLDVSRSASAKFALEAHDELVEVRTLANGEDLLLATHLVTHPETSESADGSSASIVLEAGQKLMITIAPVNSDGSTEVEVSYRETSLARATLLYVRRWAHSLSNQQSGRRTWSGTRIPTLALAIALIALGVAGTLVYVNSKRSLPTQPPLVANNQPNVGSQADGPADNTMPAADHRAANTEDKITHSGTVTRSSSRPSGTQEKGVQAERRPSEITRRSDPQSAESRVTTTPDRGAQTSDSTRNISGQPAAVPLAEIRKIYVEVLGDAQLSQKVEENLIESLRVSQKFIQAGSREEADALMKISVTDRGRALRDSVSVRVQLINARGEVIWTSGRSASNGMYTGSPTRVAVSVIRDLLDEVR